MEQVTTLFAATDGEETLWQKLHAVFSDRLGTTHILYGFSHSIYLVNRVGFTDSLIIKHSYDAAYVANFAEGNLLSDDISTAILYQDLGPHLWDDLDKRDDLTEAQRQRSALDDRFGLRSGVSLAFRFASGGGISGMELASRSMDPAEFAARWNVDATAHCTILAEFDRVMRPVMVANRLRLTPREQQVLKLSVGGMTAKEVGHHLGIKERSVFNTLERARKSLAADTTIEAVTKALAYGLI